MTLFQKGEMGGSHRVDWVGNYYTEHGPRVYTSAYVNYMQILRYLNIDFYDYYSRGENNTGIIGSYMKLIRQSPLNIPEILTLVKYYIKTLVSPTACKKISMLDVVVSFRERSKTFMDQLCKLLDGSGLKRFNCWSFFQWFLQSRERTMSAHLQINYGRKY